MSIHPLAGKPAASELLVDLDRLRREYYTRMPDVADRAQRVCFGTSGHRGSSLRSGFNEAHVLAITQAICDYRRRQAVTGPLFVGKDTHALSDPAFQTVLEVLAGNGVDVMLASVYERIDAPATTDEKAILLKLSPRDVDAGELGGEPIQALLTEDVYKLYAESFRGIDHLRRIQEGAQDLISRALTGALK